MNLTLGGNITVTHGQIGDNNTMTINHAENDNVLLEHEWMELKEFLYARLPDLSKNEESYILAKESLNCIEKKDETKLKSILNRNRESFINNVLSNVASSGIILLLSKLGF